MLKRAGSDWSNELRRRIETCPEIHDTDGVQMDGPDPFAEPGTPDPFATEEPE